MHRSFFVSIAGHMMILITLFVFNIVSPPLPPFHHPIINVHMMPPSGPKLSATGGNHSETPPAATPQPPAKPTPAPRHTPRPAAPTPRPAAPTPAPKHVIAKVTPMPRNIEAPKNEKKVFRHDKILKALPTPKVTPTPTPEATPEPTPLKPDEGLKMQTPSAEPTVAPSDNPPLPAPAATPNDSPPLPQAPSTGSINTDTQQIVVVTSDTSGGMSQTWEDQVQSRIHENFSHPLASAKITCTISFQVLKDGTIQNPKLVTSSGSPAMDQYAFDAIRKTEKLPPLYDSFDKAYTDIAIVFNFE